MHAGGRGQGCRQLRGCTAEHDAGRAVAAGNRRTANGCHAQYTVCHRQRQGLPVIGIGISENNGVGTGEVEVAGDVLGNSLGGGGQRQNRGGGIGGNRDTNRIRIGAGTVSGDNRQGVGSRIIAGGAVDQSVQGSIDLGDCATGDGDAAGAVS